MTEELKKTRSLSTAVLLACLVVALLSAVYPVVRTFSRAELLYNEGWNVYNAQTVASGSRLYPAAVSPRVVNYPALSFFLFAALHRVTGHWLMPARLASLLATFACAWMVTAILRAVGAGRRAACLGGAFALLLFCISATAYVGVDDPQMLSEAVFLFGLLVYVRREEVVPSMPRIATVALLFVVAGCIKHSALEFPLAVLLDLLFLSAARAAWFSLTGSIFVAMAVWMNIHFGGPGFLHALMLDRDFSLRKSVVMFTNLFGPLLVPLCLAAWSAMRLMRDRHRRAIALLFLAGLCVGFFFEGGSGVYINVWFGTLLAVAMLAGWAIQEARTQGASFFRADLLAAVLFAWMVIPSITEDVWNPLRLLRQQREASAQYLREVDVLKRQPGPALCESLLRCAEAGKPYLYDPFNATRLMNLGKLPQTPLLEDLRQHRFAAVQIHALLPGDAQTRERFPGAVMEAIQRYYRPVLHNEDGYILLPAQ